MAKRILLLLLACAVAAVAVAVTTHFVRKRQRLTQATNTSLVGTTIIDPDAWLRAVEAAKAPRVESTPGPLIIPPELKHYSERYWFLATQVAEIEKHDVHTCQDFLDLAALIQRGELVALPAVTDTYVLYGVGEKADDSNFSRFEEPSEPDKEAKTINSLDQEQLHRDYESLQLLARGFAGRFYDLNSPSDRHALRINMLSSIRPEALKILEEVAATYHRQFNRPLPVSSLVRPEQYQHTLRRVNRNAVLIDSPPHSTGLAFDIDYRYMTAAEQTFLMAELARIKNEGRIEVIRERNANYHVFAFLHGIRPNDDLITASLEKAKPPEKQAHHAAKTVKQKSKKSKVRKTPASMRRRRR